MKKIFKVFNFTHMLALIFIVAGLFYMDTKNPDTIDYTLIFIVPILMIYLSNDLRQRLKKLQREESLKRINEDEKEDK